MELGVVGAGERLVETLIVAHGGGRERGGWKEGGVERVNRTLDMLRGATCSSRRVMYLGEGSEAHGCGKFLLEWKRLDGLPVS